MESRLKGFKLPRLDFQAGELADLKKYIFRG